MTVRIEITGENAPAFMAELRRVVAGLMPLEVRGEFPSVQVQLAKAETAAVVEASRPIATAAESFELPPDTNGEPAPVVKRRAGRPAKKKSESASEEFPGVDPAPRVALPLQPAAPMDFATFKKSLQSLVAHDDKVQVDALFDVMKKYDVTTIKGLSALDALKYLPLLADVEQAIVAVKS